MSYYNHSEPPAWFVISGMILIIIFILGGIPLLIYVSNKQQAEANTPPPVTTVATVSAGRGAPGVEVSGHYVVETIATSFNLVDVQDPLVTWLTAHPDLRLVDVIPVGGGPHGCTSGFVIVAEARTP